jgi:hypothetical protein
MSPRLTREQREYTGLMGSSPEEGLAEVGLRSPQMYDAVVEGAFGQMMAQAGLSRAAREMTMVALLDGGGRRGDVAGLGDVEDERGDLPALARGGPG